MTIEKRSLLVRWVCVWIQTHTPGHIHIRVLNKMHITQKQSLFGIWCSLLQMMTCFPIIFFFCIQTVRDFKFMQFGNTQHEHTAQMTATSVIWAIEYIEWKTVGRTVFHSNVTVKVTEMFARMCVQLLVLGFCFKLDICIQMSHSYSPVLCHTSLQPTNICPILCFHDQIIFKLNSEAALHLLHLPRPPKYPILFHSHSRTILSSWATVFFFCPACTSHDQSHWATAKNLSLTATTATVTRPTKDGSQTGSVPQGKRSKPANGQNVFNNWFQTKHTF